MTWLRGQGLTLALSCAALAAAYALKRAYAVADADDLGWILRPTAALVTLISGEHFSVERGAGPTSRDLWLVISPACAGINYLVVVFSTLIFGFLPRLSSQLSKIFWLPLSATLAYSVTVAVNALRISAAVALRRTAESGWVYGAQAHRLLGTVVYLGALLSLYCAVDAALSRRRGAALAVPVASYLGVTLVVPVLNGVPKTQLFVEHGVFVVSVALTLSAAIWLARSRPALIELGSRRHGAKSG